MSVKKIFSKLKSINLVAKIIIVLFVISVSIAIKSITSAQSNFFISLDQNVDGELNYEEWMTYYGTHTHTLQNCSRRDFYVADCDSNEVLSWQEYYQFRMKRKHCIEPIIKLTNEQLFSIEKALEQKERALIYKYRISQ